MILYPAIDLKGGKCVRLLQGRADQETIYFDNPLEVALRWEREGAQWLHLVDLDGALASGANRELARQVFRHVQIPVQFGGGIRSLQDLSEMLDAGAQRVVLGTAAVETPQLLDEALQRFGERVVVGIDAREGRVAIKGWKQVEPVSALEFGKEAVRRGAARIVYTDIARDGMLTGPNLEATRRMADTTGARIIASGGISSLKDLIALNSLASAGVEGVIVGKALYERKFTLDQAQRALRGAQESF
ncbi:MAG: 1-(5-phosphoribosyl)-5-[(5-phosphoribosylamino)methylideneamino]imidazole-4-carboxamide isomerase [Acidobacteriota bacterium]